MANVRQAFGKSLASASDALGTDRRSNLLLMVSAPFPSSFFGRNASSFGKMIAFLNAGSTGNGDDSEFSITSSSSQVDSTALSAGGRIAGGYFFPGRFPFGAPRLSAGCGVAMRAGPARCEMTYSVPLIKAVSDDCKGFQIGFGFSFI